MKAYVKAAGLSDIGRVRRENEDRWLADLRSGLFVVADGIGGARGGGLASQAVVDTLPRLLEARQESLLDLECPAAKKEFAESLSLLSERLRTATQGSSSCDGTGSTVVATAVRGVKALIGHLGDSRAYLYRDGCLERLTNDHTMLQLLLLSGDITEGQAANHPSRGQLTRYVGMHGEPLPEIKFVDLLADDKLLLCSDGLTGMMSDAEIADIIGQAVPPPILCRQLIDAANEAGGRDNVTAVVLEVTSLPVEVNQS